MTLAEKIMALRTEKGLSQGELADRMGVSRQSVSKWETGASTPDLDKLIFLSEFFGVTLDALAKGEEAAAAGEEPCQYPFPVTPTRSMQKSIALCLLFLGGLSILLGFAVLPPLLFLGLYLLVCSLLCFAVKHHVGMVIAWGTFLGLAVLSPYLFGTHVFVFAALGAALLTTAWTIWRARRTERTEAPASPYDA